MNTNRPDLPDELRAMAGQSESPAALGEVAPLLHAAAEEFEAAGFTHEDAFSLALQGERFLAEQSREERGKAVRAGQTHIRMSAPAGPRFFKAVTLGGFDFRTGTVRWLPADGTPTPEGGWLVENPKRGEVGSDDPAGYLSASTVETDCTGFSWPARLLLVEPVGAMWTPYPDRAPRERAAHVWRVVRELPAWRLFGPQGLEVAALIEQTADLASALTGDAAWVAAMDAAWDASRVAAWDAARDAALGAAWGAALGAAWDAALGWLVKDLISVEHFRILTGPWEQVVGLVIA